MNVRYARASLATNPGEGALERASAAHEHAGGGGRSHSGMPDGSGRCAVAATLPPGPAGDGSQARNAEFVHQRWANPATRNTSCAWAAARIDGLAWEPPHCIRARVRGCRAPTAGTTVKRNAATDRSPGGSCAQLRVRFYARPGGCKQRKKIPPVCPARRASRARVGPEHAPNCLSKRRKCGPQRVWYFSTAWRLGHVGMDKASHTAAAVNPSLFPFAAKTAQNSKSRMFVEGICEPLQANLH